MTIQEILAISPLELAGLTDSQLAEKLAPLIPQARLEYIGPRTETVTIAPGVKRSAVSWKRDLARLSTILEREGIKPPTK